MKLIAIGDKSRYQFFRAIVRDQKEMVNSFNTENLGMQTLRVVSDQKYTQKSTSENVFYSRKLPLSTEIVFPSEIEVNQFPCGNNDKIIFFDEFPYRTHEKIDILTSYLDRKGTSFLEIVLLMNHRNLMNSDISTEAMAMKEAYMQYQEEGYYVNKFKNGDQFDFLYWSSGSYVNRNGDEFSQKIANRKREMSSELFDWEYELIFLREIDKYFSNPQILNTFFDYHNNNLKKNASWYYVQNAKNYFWGSKSNQFFQFAKKIYSKGVEDVCVWNLEKDLSILQDKIVKEFVETFADVDKISYDGNEECYRLWKAENKETIIEIKNRIVNFFKKELCNIIKEQINKRLEKMEELLNEK